MNNLGAALLQKQKQTAVSSVDLGTIQQKINAERQGFIDTINALKAENDYLKAENESLKAKNDTLKAENENLKTGPVKTPEVKFVFL